MEKGEIKKTWRNLLIPFIFGLIILFCSISFYYFGSKQANSQLLSFYSSIFGFIFMLFPGIKMFKFNKYLKNQQ
jgi:uncharacterized membrane protein